MFYNVIQQQCYRKSGASRQARSFRGDDAEPSVLARVVGSPTLPSLPTTVYLAIPPQNIKWRRSVCETRIDALGGHAAGTRRTRILCCVGVCRSAKHFG